MRAYAQRTEVPATQTRREIEERVLAHGGRDYTLSLGDTGARIGFRLGGRAICLSLPLPDPEDPEFTEYRRGGYQYARADAATRQLWERACRARWRALALIVQAKLEAIRLGITSVDEAFFADVMTEAGGTVYERHGRSVLPALPPKSGEQALSGGKR